MYAVAMEVQWITITTVRFRNDTSVRSLRIQYRFNQVIDYLRNVSVYYKISDFTIMWFIDSLEST